MRSGVAALEPENGQAGERPAGPSAREELARRVSSARNSSVDGGLSELVTVNLRSVEIERIKGLLLDILH